MLRYYRDIYVESLPFNIFVPLFVNEFDPWRGVDIKNKRKQRNHLLYESHGTDIRWELKNRCKKQIFIFIVLRILTWSRAVTNRIFSPKRLIFLYVRATYSEIPSNNKESSVNYYSLIKVHKELQVVLIDLLNWGSLLLPSHWGTLLLTLKLGHLTSWPQIGAPYYLPSNWGTFFLNLRLGHLTPYPRIGAPYSLPSNWGTLLLILKLGTLLLILKLGTLLLTLHLGHHFPHPHIGAPYSLPWNWDTLLLTLTLGHLTPSSQIGAPYSLPSNWDTLLLNLKLKHLTPYP